METPTNQPEVKHRIEMINKMLDEFQEKIWVLNGCITILMTERDKIIREKENAPNQSQQTNHPTAEGVLRKETRKPIAIEDDKTADTIHKNCEQEKAS